MHEVRAEMRAEREPVSTGESRPRHERSDLGRALSRHSPLVRRAAPASPLRDLDVLTRYSRSLPTFSRWPKLRRAIAHSRRSVAELVATYVEQAHVIPDADLPLITFPADPKDAKVIAAALAARADWLVTGDHHLLDARLDIPCAMMTVAEALSRAKALLRGGQ